VSELAVDNHKTRTAHIAMTLRSVRPPAPNRIQEGAVAPRPAEVPSRLYGSSTQDAFAWHVAKYITEKAIITPAAEIEAPTFPGRAVFSVDFLIEVAGRRIAVECTGARSLKEHAQQRRRDARLVASGAVDTVYRIDDGGLTDLTNDALFLIASWEKRAGAGRYLPDIFTPRGRTNLSRLASQQARGVELTQAQAAALVAYPKTAAARRRSRRRRDQAPHLLLRRFDRRFPGPWEVHSAPVPRPAATFTTVTAH
jgi:hypothetical protein